MNCSCLEGTESHITFDFFIDGVEHSDDVESDTVPPYEDRQGPDGWEMSDPAEVMTDDS